MATPYKTQEIIEALQATKGMVYLAAEAIGCEPKTIYNHMDKHPTVMAAWKAENEKMLDIGELKLYEGVVAREQWAVTLLLKTKGKDRGYVERKETTGPDGGPVKSEVKVSNDVIIVGGEKEEYVDGLKQMVAEALNGKTSGD